MLEGIPLWTCLALLDGGKINSLLIGASLCGRERITLSEVGFKTVDERKVHGGILKNRDGACFNEISNAFFFTVLTSEAPFVPLASFLCVSVWDQCHVHDLANLQERRIELRHNEVPASSAQALIVQCYSDLRRCCRCSDSAHGKSDGVWEFLDSQFVVKAVAKKIQSDGPAKTLEKLQREAKKRWKAEEGDYCDDITSVLVQLR